MKIRKLEKNEIDKVAFLCEEKMRSFVEEVGESVSVEEYKKRILDNYDLHKMSVLLDGNDIKGCLWFNIEENEINLEEIVVEENNQGLGKFLTKYVLDYARENNKSKINLNVHVGNNRAKKFFKKFDFIERTIEMSLEI